MSVAHSFKWNQTDPMCKELIGEACGVTLHEHATWCLSHNIANEASAYGVTKSYTPTDAKYGVHERTTVFTTQGMYNLIFTHETLP